LGPNKRANFYAIKQEVGEMQSPETRESSNYRQVREAIGDSIRSGEVGPEQRLPAERELARLHSVSYMTVRRAVTEMVETTCPRFGRRRVGDSTCDWASASRRTRKNRAFERPSPYAIDRVQIAAWRSCLGGILRELGRTVPQDLIVIGTPRHECVTQYTFEGVKSYFEAGGSATALITPSDEMALPVLSACRALGKTCLTRFLSSILATAR